MALPGPLPAGLDARRERGPEWRDWLARLPTLVATVASAWNLRFDGPLWHGYCSLVAPVHTADDEPAVLKAGFVDDESQHEHLALQRWGGHGAVRLLRADPRRGVMLLERLERRDVADVREEEACRVVADLYSRLHVEPMPQLREQAGYVVRWAGELDRDASVVPAPRRLVDQAVGLARDLATEPPAAVIHADLHFQNVLLAPRDDGPTWVAIDPKPTTGDPHYEIEPMLRNRFEEYREAASVRAGIRRRFHALVDAAGFDEARARDWVIVRSVLNAHWAFRDAVSAGRGLTTDERAHITGCITIAKAVQD